MEQQVEQAGQEPANQATQVKQDTQAAGTGDQDLGWTEEQKAYIKSLRDENAKYRTKAKELETQYSGLNDRFSKVEKGLKGLFGEESDDLTPEQQVEALTAQNENLVLNTALTEAALEYGIGKENFTYFKFLVQERLLALEEGEELTEEDLDALASEATRGRGMVSTSVDGKGGPAPEIPGGVSLEEFIGMGINERSALFAKNEALYKQLVAQERAAKVRK
jgi:hypothetical protein